MLENDDSLIESLLGIGEYKTPLTEAQIEWQGMPEFIQEDQSSNFQLIVHFRSEEDRQDFARIIGQSVTAKTKSLWHPILPKKSFKEKRYISDES